ncbi:MAG: hypothetical protein AAF618_01250 [Pseudomonadota bacterium]
MGIIVVVNAGGGSGASARGAGELALVCLVLGIIGGIIQWVAEQIAAANRAVGAAIEANLSSIYMVLGIAALFALAGIATWIEGRRPGRHFRLWFYFVLRLLRFALIPLAWAAAVLLGAVLVDAVMLMDNGTLASSGRNALGLGVLVVCILICARLVSYGITQRLWGYLPAIALIAAPFFFLFMEGGPQINEGIIVKDVVDAGVPLFVL